MDIEGQNNIRSTISVENNGKSNKKRTVLIGVTVLLVLLLLPAVLWYTQSKNHKEGPVESSSEAPLFKGKLIYFVRPGNVGDIQKSVIYSKNLENGEEHRIYPADDSPFDETMMLSLRCLSPTREWILFYRYNEDKPTTYLVRIDGSEVREIGKGLGLFFSPDGHSILMQTSGDKKTVNIVDLNGNVLHSWTDNLTNNLSPAKFSPDGKTVLAINYQTNERYLVDAKTGEIVENDIKESTGIVSPDGKKMIGRDKDYNFYISDLDESNKHRIVLDSKCEYTAPKWSQDGMSILIGARGTECTSDKQVMILTFNAERTTVVNKKVVFNEFDVFSDYTW